MMKNKSIGDQCVLIQAWELRYTTVKISCFWVTSGFELDRYAWFKNSRSNHKVGKGVYHQFDIMSWESRLTKMATTLSSILKVTHGSTKYEVEMKLFANHPIHSVNLLFTSRI